MSNLNNNSNLKISNERKIKKLDLESISKSNAFKTPCITSKKSEYNSKDNSENKNDEKEVILIIWISFIKKAYFDNMMMRDYENYFEFL